jgi:hypothetical protein
MEIKYQNNWLPNFKVGIELTPKTTLIGHDGWYDGGYGNWYAPAVIMNDYFEIQELCQATGKRAAELKTLYIRNREAFFHFIAPIHNKLQYLSKEAAEFVTNAVEKTVDKTENILIVTHIPPFPENSVHGDNPENPLPSDGYWLPNFSSRIMGDRLLALAEKYPDNNFVVLCGHSHGKITTKPLPNLTVKTGFAKYGFPIMSIQMLEIE